MNLKTEKAIEGVLYRQTGRLLELRDATLHEPASPPVQADGAIVVELSQVDYIQIVG